jgi:predicted pyridoxine 5'-phosphate oxidase superfamily flavin-nucleotide-binding protein
LRAAPISRFSKSTIPWSRHLWRTTADARTNNGPAPATRRGGGGFPHGTEWVMEG